MIGQGIIESKITDIKSVVDSFFVRLCPLQGGGNRYSIVTSESDLQYCRDVFYMSWVVSFVLEMRLFAFLDRS